jgi:hypothetical protein
MPKKAKLRVPQFKSEAEERAFWEKHDSTDYLDWSKAQRPNFSNLKPSTTAISLRLPLSLLEQRSLVFHVTHGQGEAHTLRRQSQSAPLTRSGCPVSARR